MKKYLLVISGFATVAIVAVVGIHAPAEGGERGPVIQAYFSPKGGVAKAVSAQIRGARKSLDIGIYMLTAPKLAHEIVTAHKRGVRVRVVVDQRMTSKWSQVKTLEENGVPVRRLQLRKERADPSNPQFHHKFAVVDGLTVLTGSFNWTVMADQRNHENLLVITDRKLAARYTQAFEKALKLAVEQDKD